MHMCNETIKSILTHVKNYRYFQLLVQKDRIYWDRVYAPTRQHPSFEKSSMGVASTSSAEDGKVRLCGDYRALNARIIPGRHSPPHIVNFVHALYGKKIFSKIDLVRAYNQIPVVPNDRAKTAITMLFGLFEFNSRTIEL